MRKTVRPRTLGNLGAVNAARLRGRLCACGVECRLGIRRERRRMRANPRLHEEEDGQGEDDRGQQQQAPTSPLPVRRPGSTTTRRGAVLPADSGWMTDGG